METMPNSLQKKVFIFYRDAIMSQLTLLFAYLHVCFHNNRCNESDIYFTVKGKYFIEFCMNYITLAICVLFGSMWTLIDEACMGGFESKQRVAIVSL